MRETVTELVVDLLLQVGRPHIVDDGRHVRAEREQSAVFAGDQLGIVQQARRVHQDGRCGRVVFEVRRGG